jgi:very-short-patch-repair endonuclease
MDATYGRGRRAEAIVARLAAAQHGVFSRGQALDAGFSRQSIGRRLDVGRWISADWAVYRPATTPASWDLTIMAACLSGPAVASHRAAARLWSLPGFGDAVPEVTAYRHRRRKADALVWHESFYLDERRDTTTLDGIPVTSATRTIVDLSIVATVAQIEVALDDVCHRGLTTTTRVGAEVDRLRRHAGDGRIRAVLEMKVADAMGSSVRAAESPLESRTARVLRSSGLPAPAPQFEVFDGRQFVGRVDFAWPEQMVALEVDGFAFHSDRTAWEKDRSRQSRLAAAGWRVHHVTHERLADPDSIIAELRRSMCVPVARIAGFRDAQRAAG